jgi:predicted ATPase
VRIVDEKEFPDRTLTLRYRFVHVLYQNALYSSLRPTRRAALSRDVAQALLGYYGEHSGTVAAELAHLLETARDFARAAEYFLLAAKNAAQVFANAEASILALRGLTLLQRLPDTPERAQRELQLQVTLGFALTSTKGYADPETGKSMARAREICEQLGETPELFPIIWGLFTYYIVKAEFQAARQFGEQLLRLGANANDTILQVGGHYALGTAAYLIGELVTGHEHYERVLALHDPQQHRAYRALYRRDPGLYSRSGIVRTLWLLGYPDQAARRLAEALTVARQTADPGSLAFALTFPVYLNQFCREPAAAEARADACIAECQAHGIVQERLWVSIVRGWALAQQGRVQEGLTEIHENLPKLGVERGEVFRPYFLALLAESLGKAGQVEDGLTAIDDALNTVERTGERYYAAELHRLKGELLLERADASTIAAAENCFHEAITIAHQQHAKSLELRAAISLSKLYQKQGKPADAHRRLSDVYGWFTEGFDTADLREARTLLKDLASTIREEATP